MVSVIGVLKQLLSQKMCLVARYDNRPVCTTAQRTGPSRQELQSQWKCVYQLPVHVRMDILCLVTTLMLIIGGQM